MVAHQPRALATTKQLSRAEYEPQPCCEGNASRGTRVHLERLQVDQTPAEGAVAWDTTGEYGAPSRDRDLERAPWDHQHVAIVRRGLVGRSDAHQQQGRGIGSERIV